MRDRIYAVQVGEFVAAAIELRNATGRSALTMHEVVSHAWAPNVKLPEVATKETLRKIVDVRKSLVEHEGYVVAPIALAYFRLINGRVFTEIEAGKCLPRRSAPQVGLLFVDHESSPKDMLVWQQWVRQEAKTTTTRGSEARTSVENARRGALMSELELQKLLMIEAAPSTDVEGAA